MQRLWVFPMLEPKQEDQAPSLDPAVVNQIICCWSATMFAGMSPEIEQAAIAAARTLTSFEQARTQLVDRIKEITHQTASGMEVAWAATEDGKRQAEAFIEESAGGRNVFVELYSNVLADFMISQAREHIS